MCGSVSMPVSDIGRSCKKKKKNRRVGTDTSRGGQRGSMGTPAEGMPNRWILVYIWIANVRPLRGHTRLPVESRSASYVPKEVEEMVGK